MFSNADQKDPVAKKSITHTRENDYHFKEKG